MSSPASAQWMEFGCGHTGHSLSWTAKSPGAEEGTEEGAINITIQDVAGVRQAVGVNEPGGSEWVDGWVGE